jgi:peptidyl-prolyl cis-trans isomerase C
MPHGIVNGGGTLRHCKATILGRVCAGNPPGIAILADGPQSDQSDRPGLSAQGIAPMTSQIAVASPVASRPPARRGRLLGLVAAVALASVAALVSAPAQAQDKNAVAARVNGMEIRQGDLDIAEAEVGEGLPGDTGAAKRDALISFYADMILAARAAEQKGMGSTIEFARKLAYAKTKLLMETLLQEEVKTAVTDKALRELYDQAVKDMGKEQEVRAHHILVETEDEAKAILTQLKGGTDFATLAKEKSKDPGAASGGDLGYFTKDQMVPEFAEVAFKLEKGQLSDPVKTQFGWHIIRTDDRRNKPVPEYDKVKPQLVQFLVRRTQAGVITKLREGAQIEKVPVPGQQP